MVNLSRQVLCLVYAVIAGLALVGTWGNNIQYLNLGFVGANLRFWQDTFANPASRSITVDLFFLMLAATVWMLLEARKLSMKGAWLYVLFAMLIAVSVTFPIFMIHRERTLAARDGSAQGGTLSTWDLIGLGALALVMLVYTLQSLHR